MTEEKKPNIFKRAFKYMKDDLSLDKDMKEFVHKIAIDEIDHHNLTEIDVFEIGEQNDVVDDERIKKSFTTALDAELKEIIEKETTDNILNTVDVADKIDRINKSYYLGDKKGQDTKISERLNDIFNVSKYVYLPLEELNFGRVDGINLQRGEIAYLVVPASWKEQKQQTKRVNYGGIGLSMKVVKGVYIRSGSIAAQPVKQTYLADIISGNMIVTNKRIIFDAGANVKAINIKDIIKMIPYTDALALNRGTTNPALIFTDFNKPALMMLLEKIFDEYYR